MAVIESDSKYVILKIAIENFTQEQCDKYLDRASDFLVGSALSKLPEESQKTAFTAMLQDSVGYMVSGRLSIPQGAYNNDTVSMKYLELFDTPNSVLLLGTATKELGASLLRIVEQEVKQIDLQRRMQNEPFP